jgi:hypothetical protein
LIELNNQIILGLDTPSDSLIEVLMVLISQDYPGDQAYEFVDKSGSGMGTTVKRLRGMPVLFTTSVIDDTRAPRFSEKNRRLPFTSLQGVSLALSRLQAVSNAKAVESN